jgi:hypothetical protein
MTAHDILCAIRRYDSDGRAMFDHAGPRPAEGPPDLTEEEWASACLDGAPVSRVVCAAELITPTSWPWWDTVYDLLLEVASDYEVMTLLFEEIALDGTEVPS